MTRPDRYAPADEYAGHPTPPRRPETVVRMLVDKAGYVVGGQFRVKDKWVSPKGSRFTAGDGENGEPDFHTYIRSTRREVEPEVTEGAEVVTRTVVLLNGQRKRTYPVPLGAELQDAYTLDGERWVVVAVLNTEDVPNPTLTPVTP